jgi:succinoglycan biosynthesis protein ExoM
MTMPHISVCICTFKRPELLKHLLECLQTQKTQGQFTYSVVVSDNDAAESARPVVTAFLASSHLPVAYCVEPQQNIALARNNAVRHATGEFIAFIDDDEFPAEAWLQNLYNACISHQVAGVLGPVKSHFETQPPRWIIDGKFFDRPSYPTGHTMNWTACRTGNVLFRRSILASANETSASAASTPTTSAAAPFASQFDTAGEDVDFFRRMMQQGHKFIWCNEAVAYEIVPASRCRRSYLLRRALLRGSNFPKHPSDRLSNVARSLAAVPCYTVALPVLALFGQHIFLRYLIKLLDHSSRLLAYAGLPLVSQRQT